MTGCVTPNAFHVLERYECHQRHAVIVLDARGMKQCNGRGAALRA
jgi:hypothetical protein